MYIRVRYFHWPTKVRHKLHRHVIGIQFISSNIIFVVNSEKLLDFLMSIGKMFQIFGAKYLQDLKP